MKKVFKLLALASIFVIMGLTYLLYKSMLSRDHSNFKKFTKHISTKPNSEIFNKMHSLSYLNKQYRYIYQALASDQEISLNENFKQKEIAKNLKEKYGCDVLVNAGFYDKSDQPLGWFTIDNRLIHTSISSRLFDGYVFQNEQGIQIDLEKTNDNVGWGFQTGPMLYWQQKPTKIKILDDKYSRRMILLKLKSETVIILAITADDLLSSGPYLQDLPMILTNISNLENWHISEAINLDGGRASVLFTPEINLVESTWTGSFLCIK